MKLSRYEKFIQKFGHSVRPSTGYYERHHIVPKCLGGSDDLANLVFLSARAHFIAHRLLVLAYPEEPKLVYSLWAMMNLTSKGKRDFQISSRVYQKTREDRSSHLSEKFKGRTMSPEWRSNIGKATSRARTGKPGKKHSEESRARISKAKTGKSPSVKMSEETRKKISLALTGRKGPPCPEERKAAVSAKLKGRVFSEEHKKKLKEAVRRRLNRL